MPLLKDLYDTYMAREKTALVFEEGREPLIPVAHWIFRADIEVVLTQQGEFMNLFLIPDEETLTVIPVTEDSVSRAMNLSPHPLHDRLSYLSPRDATRHGLYMSGLREWAEEARHPALDAVLSYLDGGGDPASEMERMNVKADVKDPMIRWNIHGMTPPYQDTELFRSWTDFYLEMIGKGQKTLCMVTGRMMPPARMNPRTMIPIFAKAKLIPISNTDPTAYQGRAETAEDCFSIGFETSWKVHAALRWLCSREAVYYGGRVSLCWNPKGFRVPSLVNPILSGEETTDGPVSWTRALRMKILGLIEEAPKDAEAVTLVLTAFSDSKLSVIGYSRWPLRRLEENMARWDSKVSWWFPGRGFTSPSLIRLTVLAYGMVGPAGLKVLPERTAHLLSDLIRARTEGGRMPPCIREELWNRLMINQGIRRDKRIWEEMLSALCAVLKGSREEEEGKEMDITMDSFRNDRSFQYGRVLAVLDRAEKETFGRETQRDTSSMRRLNAFRTSPATAANDAWQHVRKAYWPELSKMRRDYYDSLLEEIFICIAEFPRDTLDAETEPSFLMGYYLQRKEMKEGKAEKEEKDEA